MLVFHPECSGKGFTLLEVMVAVAILALALTAVFSSQVGAVKTAKRAQTTAVATLLARCKMNELEQQVLQKGLPAVSADDEDDCCAGGEVAGYGCKWRIERIVLPDLSQLGAQKKGAANPAADALPGAAPASPLPPSSPTLPTATSSNVDPNKLLSGAGLTGGAGGGDGLAQLAMSYALPVLKPVIEEQVRRATVEVQWKEGRRPQSLKLTQFLVAEQASQATPPGLNPSTPGATSGSSTTAVPGAAAVPTTTPLGQGVRR